MIGFSFEPYESLSSTPGELLRRRNSSLSYLTSELLKHRCDNWGSDPALRKWTFASLFGCSEASCFLRT